MNKAKKEEKEKIISVEEYLDKRRELREKEIKKSRLNIDRTWSVIQTFFKYQN